MKKNLYILREAADKLQDALIHIELAGISEIESGVDICCYGIVTEKTVPYGLAVEYLLDGLKEILEGNEK